MLAAAFHHVLSHLSKQTKGGKGWEKVLRCCGASTRLSITHHQHNETEFRIQNLSFDTMAMVMGS